MRTFLAWVLVFLTFMSASARTAFASAERDSKQAAKLKLEIDSLSLEAFIKVKLKDHQKIQGGLVARSEESFELAAHTPISISYTEAKSVDPAGQSSPANNQNPPQHHSHHVRNIVIGVAAMFALAVIFAAAAK